MEQSLTKPLELNERGVTEVFSEWYAKNPYEQMTNSAACLMAFKAGAAYALSAENQRLVPVKPWRVPHPLESKLRGAAPVQAEQCGEILTEHSGCGRGIQVDQLTVRMYPGDKVVMIRGAIGKAYATSPRGI